MGGENGTHGMETAVSRKAAQHRAGKLALSRQSRQGPRIIQGKRLQGKSSFHHPPPPRIQVEQTEAVPTSLLTSRPYTAAAPEL